jgi:RNA polymerase primary sigma factor
MEMSLTDVKENLKIANVPISMDAPLSTDEESVSLYDIYMLSEPTIIGTETIMNQNSLKKDIARLFRTLNEREVLILSMYYGLGGYIAMSLEEISTKLGLTSERVRQVKARALRKLRDKKNAKRLLSYL